MKPRHFRPVAPQRLFPPGTRTGPVGTPFDTPGARPGYDRPTTPMKRGYPLPPKVSPPMKGYPLPPKGTPWGKLGRGLGSLAGWLTLAEALGLDPTGMGDPWIIVYPPDYWSTHTKVYDCNQMSASCVGTVNPAQPYATRPSNYVVPTACPVCENHGIRYTTFEDAAAAAGGSNLGSYVTFYLKRSITTGNVGKAWRRHGAGPGVNYVTVPAPVFYPDLGEDWDPFEDPWPDHWPGEKYYGAVSAFERGLAPRPRPGTPSVPGPNVGPDNPPNPPGPPPTVEYEPGGGRPPHYAPPHEKRPPEPGDEEEKPAPMNYGLPGKVYGGLTEFADMMDCMNEAAGYGDEPLKGTMQKKAATLWKRLGEGNFNGAAFEKCMAVSNAKDTAIGKLGGGAAKAMNRSPYVAKRPYGYRGGDWGTRMH